MTMRASRAVVILTMLAFVPARAASAQTPAPTEAQLLQRSAQNPDDIPVLLDLAKLYVEQKRFDDASRMLTRAMDAVHLEQARSSPAGLGPYRVGGSIAQPNQIKYVGPVYPQIAQTARVQGDVIVELIINPQGRVSAAKVIKSIPLLDQAALDAVRQWIFEPSTFQGSPIAVIMVKTVTFTLR